MEFKIPVNYDDLLKIQDDNDDDTTTTTTTTNQQQFTVNRIIDVEALSESGQLKILDAIRDRIANDPIEITHHNNFDNLYFFIKSLASERIPLDVRNQVLNILQESIGRFVVVVRNLLRSNHTDASTDDIEQYKRKLVGNRYKNDILVAAKQRLTDKAALVRKNAIHLVYAVLENNNHSLDFSSEYFNGHYKKFQQLQQDLKNQDMNYFFEDLKSGKVQNDEEDDNDNESIDNNNNENEEDNVVTSTTTNKDELTPQQRYEKKIEKRPTKLPFLYPQKLKLNDKIFKECIADTPFEKSGSIHQTKWITNVYFNMRVWFQQAFEYIKQFDDCIDRLTELLSSAHQSDISETIRLIVLFNEYRISGARSLALTMFSLVFSKESAIVNETLEAFKRLLQPNGGSGGDNGHSSTHCYKVAKNLIDFTKDTTVGVFTSLEELIQQSLRKGVIQADVIDALWKIFARQIKQYNNKDDIRGAIVILSMIGGHDGKIISSKVNDIIKYGFDSKDFNDGHILRYSCIAIQKLRFKEGVLNPNTPRYKNDHEIIERLEKLVKQSADDVEKWIIFAEPTVTAIYMLSDQPDAIAGKIIASLESFSASDTTVASSGELCKLFFMLGHIALRQLEHIESVISEMKKKRQESGRSNTTAAATVDSTNKSKSSKKKSNKKDGKEDAEDEQEVEEDTMLKELGSEEAEAENEEDKLQEGAEKDLVDERHIIGRYIPMIRDICLHYREYNDRQLQSIATLTLVKLMCVQSDLCSKQLPLIFTILKESPYDNVKCNIIIGLGDLVVRFPNLIEPYSKHIYERLRDANADVRNTTVMVLTHLILNGMLKPKSHISEMAICIEDAEPMVQQNTKLFFTNLSQKGNELYNYLPEVISKLTTDTTILMSNDKIREILKFMFSFITKDRQNESLIERIVQRFKTAQNITEAQNISYCLQILPFTENALKKLLENFKVYQDKLFDEEVNKNMCSIITKSKKATINKSNELKQTLVELESKFNKENLEKEAEDEGLPLLPSSATAAAATSTSKNKKTTTSSRNTKAAAKTKTTKNNKKNNKQDKMDIDGSDDDDESEEEADDDEDDDDEDDSPPPPKQSRSKKAAAPAKPTTTSSKKAAAASKKPSAPTPKKPAAAKRKPAAKKKVESDSDESMEDLTSSESEESESEISESEISESESD
ncbi:condensin-2 complex subunit D3 [Heterostelium album PN500]|uniref:Condensin-2 complex subunit D3 n=1 Tax=Heterostelium pallidum (strain ATCC 26659 / Pp 5 / PN500) TaxID=670386 RepID=D3B114_HETP5|nr:condensin-2 complex subunit D3 [Heterostelium album PN500]EFA84988.1 condensin-2 complex subunit D3 [Heterostelium album PN500]|eukprot:XP_020437098.1 condensin-2 complex subunit D3 [Heterostelium album PN500]